MIRIDPLRPLRRPLFRNQRRHRQFLPSRITDVFHQIRVRQLLRLDHRVQRIRRAKAPILLSQRKRLHDVQHLQRRHPLHVRRQFVDNPVAIRRGNRLDKFARIVRQILAIHRPAMALHRLQNLRGNFTFVERVPAMLRNLLQRPRQIRIAKHLAHSRRAVPRKVSLRSCFISAQIIHFGRPIPRCPFRHRKSVLRRSNRRRQIFRPLSSHTICSPSRRTRSRTNPRRCRSSSAPRRPSSRSSQSPRPPHSRRAPISAHPPAPPAAIPPPRSRPAKSPSTAPANGPAPSLPSRLSSCPQEHTAAPVSENSPCSQGSPCPNSWSSCYTTGIPPTPVAGRISCGISFVSGVNGIRRRIIVQLCRAA